MYRIRKDTLIEENKAQVAEKASQNCTLATETNGDNNACLNYL